MSDTRREREVPKPSDHSDPWYPRNSIPDPYKPLAGVILTTAILSVAYGIAQKVDPTKANHFIHQTLGDSNLEVWQLGLVILAAAAIAAGIYAAYQNKDSIKDYFPLPSQEEVRGGGATTNTGRRK